MSKRLRATVVMALLCVIWGGTFPATKAAVSVTDPIVFLTLRFTIALVILVGILVVRRAMRDVRSNEEHPPLPPPQAGGNLGERWDARSTNPPFNGRGGLLAMVVVGLFMSAGFALQNYGMKYTTASRSGFFTGLLVITTPILASLLKTSHMPRAGWYNLPVAFAGIWLMSDPSGGGLNLGDWLTIGCAVLFAFHMVSLEVAARRMSDALMGTTIQIAVICVLGWLWMIASGVRIEITATGWVAGVFTGLFGGVIALWAQTRFQPDLPAGQAALILCLEPVFAALFAWMLLGDSWTTRGLLGAGMILAAMVVAAKGIRG